MSNTAILFYEIYTFVQIIWIYVNRKTHSEKEDFELLLKSQIESGYNLLNREISEDKTTFIQPRRIIRIKEYDESEKELFLADYKNGIRLILS